ncbi:patatin-like phospholipase family protein [Streptomyces cyaneofuscatus]|uniref:patatin-like phospholipase family protein n=1 Tax=Streptomyces cyaneofuscatus TaxID=66883 RepID=UPI0033A8C530
MGDGGRALVLGCGGTLGLAWSAVALRAVERALDWDSRSADVIVGTSAGAELALILASGRTPEDLVAALEGRPDADPLLRAHLRSAPRALPPVPVAAWPGRGLTGAARRGRVSRGSGLVGLLPRGRGDATWLRRLAIRLGDDISWPDARLRLMASDAATGERVALGAPGGPKVSPADALAASWAVPGWFPPVRIGGRELLDGGAVSPTSADLLAADRPDEVVIVAPMSTAGGAAARGPQRFERVLRRWMTATVDAEERLLRAAGVRCLRIEPDVEQLAAMGPNFMNPARRAVTVAAARRTTPGTVARALARADYPGPLNGPTATGHARRP